MENTRVFYVKLSSCDYCGKAALARSYGDRWLAFCSPACEEAFEAMEDLAEAIRLAKEEYSPFKKDYIAGIIANKANA